MAFKNRDQDEYTVKILSQIQEMFDEECENFIDKSEFEDSKKATAFIHALANVVPNIIYQKLTGEKLDLLAFNHAANRLCFQYGKSQS